MPPQNRPPEMALHHLWRPLEPVSLNSYTLDRRPANMRKCNESSSSCANRLTLSRSIWPRVNPFARFGGEARMKIIDLSLDTQDQVPVPPSVPQIVKMTTAFRKPTHWQATWVSFSAHTASHCDSAPACPRSEGADPQGSAGKVRWGSRHARPDPQGQEKRGNHA